MEKNQDNLDLLRKISKKPQVSQRILANELGFSLGKLNYCLRALKKKGLVKIKNFKNNKNKINYIYILTPKGIAKKSLLTVNFMKRKMKEYEELKNELENINENVISISTGGFKNLTGLQAIKYLKKNNIFSIELSEKIFKKFS